MPGDWEKYAVKDKWDTYEDKSIPPTVVKQPQQPQESFADKYFWNPLHSASEGVSSFISNHPGIKDAVFGRGYVTDPSGKKIPLIGDETLEVPGAGKLADYLHEAAGTGKFGNTFASGFLGDIAGTLTGALSSGADPTNIGLAEVPHRAFGKKEIPEIKPEIKPEVAQNPEVVASKPKLTYTSEGKLVDKATGNEIPIPNKEIPPPEVIKKTPQDYIDDVKSGKLPKGISWEDYQTMPEDVLQEPTFKIPETKGGPVLKEAANSYIDGIKDGTIPKGTSFSDWQKSRPLVSQFIKGEEGAVRVGKSDPKFVETVSNTRQEIIDSLIQGKQLDLASIMEKSGLDKKQFNKIVDEIIDTKATEKVAKIQQETLHERPEVNSLLQAIKSAIPLREEQEALYHVERGKRFSAFKNVKQEGREGAFKQLSQLKGEMPKVPVSPMQLTAEDTDKLFSSIKNSIKLTEGEKARGYVALAQLIEGGPVPQRGQLTILDRAFGHGFGEDVMTMYGGLPLGALRLGKVANTMKSMQASVDLSAPLRQGIGLVHRKEYWQAFGEMFKYAASHDAFEALNTALEERPNYLIGRKSGLYLASKDLGMKEEQFANSYLSDLEKIPGVGKVLNFPFAASERAYTGFLNKLRADTFDNMLNSAVKAGHDANEIAPAIAKYVNVSTGRGNLGKLNKYGEELNTAFFSPRLISSRLTILNPKYYIDAPAFVRKEALKTLTSIAAFVGTVNGVAYLANKSGIERESDPRSSDFGKLVFGRTRLDPGGGFLQYITLGTRMLAGGTKSTTGEKKITQFNSSYTAPTRESVALNFARGKLSPFASLVDSALRGTDFSGQPINYPKEVMNRFIPLIAQDAMDLAREEPENLPLLVPMLFGMGGQTYEQRTPSSGGMRAPSMSMKP